MDQCSSFEEEKEMEVIDACKASFSGVDQLQFLRIQIQCIQHVCKGIIFSGLLNPCEIKQDDTW